MSVHERLLSLGLALAYVAVSAVASAAAPRAPGDQLWVARFNGYGDFFDDASASALSPDGQTLYVLGDSETGYYADFDWVTVAYDTTTGHPRWVQYYGTGGEDYSQELAVSPDGSKLFVTGWQEGANATSDWATLAYDAATGTMLWKAVYKPSSFIDGSRDVGVSPDGSTVFVTGLSYIGSWWDLTTIAYDALTGSRLWLQNYDGPANRDDEGELLAVSPDDSTVYVSGYSTGIATNTDFVTIAYDARTGSPRWVRRYDGPYHYNDWPEDLVLSPDGTRVFVTGHSDFPDTPNHYATVAYDAATGATLWVRRSQGRGINDQANAEAVSPDGSTLFVTGYTEGHGRGYDYGTIAYEAATGAELWKTTFDGEADGQDTAYAIGVSRDGATVFVTGSSEGKRSGADFGTIAYDAINGAIQWIRRYNGPGNDIDNGLALAVSPDGSGLFVSGTSDGGAPDYDIATVADET